MPPKPSKQHSLQQGGEAFVLQCSKGVPYGVTNSGGGWQTSSDNTLVYRSLKAAMLAADLITLQGIAGTASSSTKCGKLNFSYEARRGDKDGQLEVRRMTKDGLMASLNVSAGSCETIVSHRKKIIPDSDPAPKIANADIRMYCSEREYMSRSWLDRVGTVGNIPTSFCYEVVFSACNDECMSWIPNNLSSMFQQGTLLGSSGISAGSSVCVNASVASDPASIGLPLQVSAIFQAGDILLMVDGVAVSPAVGESRLLFSHVCEKVSRVTPELNTKKLRLLRPAGLPSTLAPSPAEIAGTCNPIVTFQFSSVTNCESADQDQREQHTTYKVQVNSMGVEILPPGVKRQTEAAITALNFLSSGSLTAIDTDTVTLMGRMSPWEFVVDSRFSTTTRATFMPRIHGASNAANSIFRDRTRWCVNAAIKPEIVTNAKRARDYETITTPVKRTLPLQGHYLLNKFESEDAAVTFHNSATTDHMATGNVLSQKLLLKLMDSKGEQIRVTQAAQLQASIAAQKIALAAQLKHTEAIQAAQLKHAQAMQAAQVQAQAQTQALAQQQAATNVSTASSAPAPTQPTPSQSE